MMIFVVVGEDRVPAIGDFVARAYDDERNGLLVLDVDDSGDLAGRLECTIDELDAAIRRATRGKFGITLQ